MKRLSRHSSAWLIVLAVWTTAPAAASQPVSHSAPPSVSAVPHDGACTASGVTRLAWDRVGSPLHGMS